jgi:hypothetical protein
MDSETPRIDVAQLSQGRFLAHGELQVWHRERLLCYAAAGPFNVEMVSVMSRAVGRLLLTWQPPAVYVAVAWWHGSLLASPEVLAAYGQLLRRGRDVMPAEQASLWLVGPDVEGASIMKPRWQALHAACGYRLEFCDTEAGMLARAQDILTAAGVAG